MKYIVQAEIARAEAIIAGYTGVESEDVNLDTFNAKTIKGAPVRMVKVIQLMQLLPDADKANQEAAASYINLVDELAELATQPRMEGWAQKLRSAQKAMDESDVPFGFLSLLVVPFGFGFAAGTQFETIAAIGFGLLGMLKIACWASLMKNAERSVVVACGLVLLAMAFGYIAVDGTTSAIAFLVCAMLAGHVLAVIAGMVGSASGRATFTSGETDVDDFQRDSSAYYNPGSGVSSFDNGAGIELD